MLSVTHDVFRRPTIGGSSRRFWGPLATSQDGQGAITLLKKTTYDQS